MEKKKKKKANLSFSLLELFKRDEIFKYWSQHMCK